MMTPEIFCLIFFWLVFLQTPFFAFTLSRVPHSCNAILFFLNEIIVQLNFGFKNVNWELCCAATSRISFKTFVRKGEHAALNKCNSTFVSQRWSLILARSWLPWHLAISSTLQRQSSCRWRFRDSWQLKTFPTSFGQSNCENERNHFECDQNEIQSVW